MTLAFDDLQTLFSSDALFFKCYFLATQASFVNFIALICSFKTYM